MQTKFCIRCEEIKLISEFHNNKSKKDGKHEYCKECLLRYQRENYRRRRTIDPQYKNKKSKNPHGIYQDLTGFTDEQKRVRRRDSEKKYRTTEKGQKYIKKRSLKRYYKDVEYSRLKRKARRLGIQLDILKEIIRRDKVCQLCQSDENLQFDHIFPVALGGMGSFDNLQLLCASCNNFKSNNLLLQENSGIMIVK